MVFLLSVRLNEYALHTLPGGARSLEERADASKTTIRLSPVQLPTHNSEGKIMCITPWPELLLCHHVKMHGITPGRI